MKLLLIISFSLTIALAHANYALQEIPAASVNAQYQALVQDDDDISWSLYSYAGYNAIGCYLDGHLVAMIAYRNGSAANEVHMGIIFVKKAHRKRGLPKWMIADFEAKMRSMGKKKVTVQAVQDTSGMYSHFGYLHVSTGSQDMYKML
ncbi:acetyltransferase (GNAT) domain-containing protein [Ditylenchus destructor]|uniref:Acetyltransferase (GNAT) domain-containing protein n=1 Tax=Ditylenchus destructor TaxID=166010 RepID=A0AAD4QYX1_9BILA|nr:acetyltransferase (GNAT) domain-containing protein [Ditylenchus destructor]